MLRKRERIETLINEEALLLAKHLRDEIPCKFVFGRIKALSGKILINPEIHQKNRVQQVIKFCNDLLNIQ